MKNKSLLISVVCVMAVIFLCGCSLAVPGAGAEDGDRLIGVFITADYLDLFDMDGYVDDHVSDFVKGGQVIVEKSQKYEGRLYAKIDKSRGEHSYDWEISFGDVEGINMFQPLWTDENGEKYHASVCSEGVSDVHMDLNVTDDGENNKISGTIYMVSGKADKNVACYANPVYQTAEGDIYAVSGQGFSIGGETAEGQNFSETWDEDVTVTENGKKKTEKNSVTVSYAVMNRPVQITIYQMDREHQIIKQKSYEPEEVPEELLAKRGTEYILVETEKEAPSGNTIVSREVYTCDPGEKTDVETYYALDNGVVAKRATEIRWSGYTADHGLRRINA